MLLLPLFVFLTFHLWSLYCLPFDLQNLVFCVIFFDDSYYCLTLFFLLQTTFLLLLFFSDLLPFIHSNRLSRGFRPSNVISDSYNISATCNIQCDNYTI